MINKAETTDINSNSEEQITLEIKGLENSSIENLEGSKRNDKNNRQNGVYNTDHKDPPSSSQSSDSSEVLEDCSINDDLDTLISSEILHNIRTKLTGFPADSFACSNCGELLRFTQHLNRKTIHIVHQCSNCGSSLEFFNRCSFLLHIKGHGILPTNAYLKTTTKFEVIAESQYLNFEYGEIDDKLLLHCNRADQCVTPISDNNELVIIEERANSPSANITEAIAENSAFSCQEPSSESLTISSNEKPYHNIIQNCIPSSSPKKRSEFWCFGCDRDFSDAKDFSLHLKEQETNGAAGKTIYNCNIDNIPSYSCCKYMLHNKVIHEKSCPFMCPECGQCFDCWDHLYDHTKYKCFHLSQSLRYSCVLNTCCTDDGTKLLYRNFGDLMQHFAKEHHKIVLQCLYCSHAFATCEWLFKHLLNDRHKIDVSDSLIRQLSIVLDPDSSSTSDPKTLAHRFSKSLIQCLICNVVFCSESSYHQHFSNKLNDHSEMKIVFTCEKCFQHFDNGAELENHLKENSLGCNVCVKQESAEPHSESESTESTDKFDSFSIGKASKLSSRTYRPRPKPLRVQPARAAATTTIPNIPNPNYVLSSSINIRNGPLRQHIRQQCRHCRQSFDLSAIRRHENTCSKLQLDPGYCLACKQNYQGSLLLWYHGKNYLRNGLKICLFCNNKEIQSDCGESDEKEFKVNDVLHHHFYNDHVANTKLPFKCLLCREVMSNKEGVYAHLKKHHDLTTIDSFQVKRSRSFQISQLPRVPSKGKLQNELKPLQSPSKRDSSSVTTKPYQDGHNKKHKKLNNEDLTSNANGAVEGENDETVMECHDGNGSEKHFSKPMPCVSLVTKTQNARDQEGKFNCFKCDGFFAKTEDEFCEHIRLNHVLCDQEEERHYNGGIGIFPVEFLDFWCPECDISFVVKPSLVKHLQFSHDYIEDVDEYMKKVGYDSKRPVKENQCEICYLRCADSIDHYNHMKTHGLAFLRLRQQRKPPDK